MEAYRSEVREITKSILDLVVARQKLAQRIAAVKGSSGYAIENHRVEEKLSSEMVDYGKSQSLDRELALKIVDTLIEYSKIAQRREIYLPSIRSYLRDSKITTISIFGAGRMGRWFAKYFAEAGARVILFDKNSKLTKKAALELGCGHTNNFGRAVKSDLLVVAVPISSTGPLIVKLARQRGSNGNSPTRIVEISSVKSGLAKMQSKLGRNVKLYSIHPLFGPLVNRFAENSMVQVGRDSSFATGVFPHFRIFQMSIQDHDRLMATLLTIPHFHALSFAQEVSKRTIPNNIRSPSFDHLQKLSTRVLGESDKVYYEIQASNPFANRAIGDTINAMRSLQALLKNRNKFKKIFREMRRSI